MDRGIIDKTRLNSPFSGKFYFWEVISVMFVVFVMTMAIFFFVDGYFFFAARTAIPILLVDDLFLFVASTIFTVRKRCGE